MTDKQIEEALKYCAIHDFTNYCDKCPLNSIMGCRNELMMRAFDSIQKLKNDSEHEIERLNNEYSKAFERLKSQQREIDRLKEENEFLDRAYKDTIRNNAFKEFVGKLNVKEIERLKNKAKFYYNLAKSHMCDVIYDEELEK